MGRRPEIYVNLKGTTRKVTAFTVVNRLYHVVLKAGSKDIRDLRNPKHAAYSLEWVRLVSLLQHNEERATVINGVPYALGGVYSGKETPHRSLTEMFELERYAGMVYHPTSTGRKCGTCGQKIGHNVTYKRLEDGKGELPSLNASHGIPAILGGSSTAANVCVECAYCNKERGMFFDPAVRAWLKKTMFKVYE